MILKHLILFVAPYPPPVHGSSMVSQQIRDSIIINDTFECGYVNLSTSRSMNEIGKASPVILFKKVCRFLNSYISLFFKLLFHKYDLCYLATTCNGIGFLKDAPLIFTCKLFCKNIVIHQHNKGMSSYVDRSIYGFLLRRVYKNVQVILLSWNLYEDISKVVAKEDVMVCPNGIPMPSYITKLKDCKSNSVPELLYLSNLIESKGVYALLDACKILKDKGLSFHCTFVGGETKQISKEIFNCAVKDRNIVDCVKYVGPKYGEDKEIYWNKADIFVFPTFYYNECFPLVLLEAMQHRLPIVSTREGGISDIVEDGKTGFLVDNNILREESCSENLVFDATDDERKKSRQFNYRRGVETADAIEKMLLDCVLREKMGEEGYLKYETTLTDKVFETRMRNCLLSCINR